MDGMDILDGPHAKKKTSRARIGFLTQPLSLSFSRFITCKCITALGLLTATGNPSFLGFGLFSFSSAFPRVPSIHSLCLFKKPLQSGWNLTVFIMNLNSVLAWLASKLNSTGWVSRRLHSSCSAQPHYNPNQRRLYKAVQFKDWERTNEPTSA